IGIPDNCVAEAAKSIGCSIMKAPFKYLGILVGDNMSSIKAWDETISKMKKRLSRWKLNTLSVEGLPGFDDLVTKSWNSFVLDDSNGMTRFKKLQMLKKEIRTWTLDYKRQQVGHSKDLKSKLSDIDKMFGSRWSY
nr:RNA-directed DNA polymerase, eukaryota [Tanacetum cinerariifolium]